MNLGMNMMRYCTDFTFVHIGSYLGGVRWGGGNTSIRQYVNQYLSYVSYVDRIRHHTEETQQQQN